MRNVRHPVGPAGLSRVSAAMLRVAALSVIAVCAWAQYPSYPPTPTLIEYVVDPAWPKRPAELGPPVAVPGITVDKQDRIWCVQRGEVPVLVYSPEGNLLRSWGKGEFKSAHSLRFDSQGNVWVSDYAGHVVKKLTPEGKLLLTIGVPGKAGEDETHLNQPTDTAVTPSGDVFVSDGYGNRRVVQFNSQGKFVRAWGRYGSGQGEFSLPHQVVLDSRGTLYVADRNSGRIHVFDQKGQCLEVWNNIIMPWGLWMSPRDELWVCGSSPQWWRKDGGYPPPKDQIVMRFSTDGKLRQFWSIPICADGEEKPGYCNWLHAVAVDSKGNLYTGEINGKRAQKFVPLAWKEGKR